MTNITSFTNDMAQSTPQPKKEWHKPSLVVLQARNTAGGGLPFNEAVTLHGVGSVVLDRGSTGTPPPTS